MAHTIARIVAALIALTILGSRAASMTSVVISQLFSSKFNDDKKLLTFSDSVQDASHRASFFGARTFRFNFRSALQQFVAAQDNPLKLSEASELFIKFWRDRWDEPKFVTSFLPPDLAWFEDYEFLKENGKLPKDSTLPLDLGPPNQLGDHKRIWIQQPYRADARKNRMLDSICGAGTIEAGSCQVARRVTQRDWRIETAR